MTQWPSRLGEDGVGERAITELADCGRLDDAVIELDRRAYEKIQAQKHFAIVPGATHLFEEPGTLQAVARLAADWFKRYLGGNRV